jgi:hypothetical protein
LFGLYSLFTFNVICYIFNNMKLTSILFFNEYCVYCDPWCILFPFRAW